MCSEEDVKAAMLQFVRKNSGYHVPLKANAVEGMEWGRFNATVY